MRILPVIYGFLALLCLMQPVLAQTPVHGQDEEIVTEDEMDLKDPSGEAATIRSIENYLESFRSMRADFIQTDSNGGEARGRMYLSRPGKIRFDYDLPTPVLLVSDGGSLVYYDSKLQQVTYIPLGSTPAEIIIGDKINLNSKEIKIVNLERRAGEIVMALQSADKQRPGLITFFFQEEPIALRRWSYVDGQQVTTTVSLQNIETNIAFDTRMFRFIDPRPPKERF